MKRICILKDEKGMTDYSKEKVTLTVNDVDPLCRHLFNIVCRWEKDKSRGEILSRILMEAAKEKLGENGVASRTDSYNEHKAVKLDLK
jgi:hypothetical protein